MLISGACYHELPELHEQWYVRHVSLAVVVICLLATELDAVAAVIQQPSATKRKGCSCVSTHPSGNRRKGGKATCPFEEAISSIVTVSLPVKDQLVG